MNIDELIELHPRLFHMAHPEAWGGVQAHGLLSTEALMDKFEIEGAERDALLGCRRPDSVLIEHPRYGSAVIRDNRPMNDSALSRCLRDDITPTQWYRRLNGYVFFWTRPERLTGLLKARSYRDAPHLVLEIDTAKLVDAHTERIRLSPINSGSAIRRAASRGNDTFESIETFPFEKWRARRGNRRAAVVELVVEYQVRDVIEFLHSACVRHPNGEVDPLV